MQYMQGHLGGYVIGGDEATYYPELWSWLVDSYGVKSVLDVGCGEGHALDYFEQQGGIDPTMLLGVDGVPQDHLRIVRHDFVNGPFSWAGAEFDLCWSCEFVEHVEEQYVPNFLSAFAHAKLVLMTHAGPGQAGYHHVNCQTSDYWRGAMTAIGYELDHDLTVLTRHLAEANHNPYNHYLRSGLAFKKR